MHDIKENIWVICILWTTCAFACMWVTIRQNIWYAALYPFINIKTERLKYITGLIIALITISFIFLNPFIHQSNLIEVPLLIFTPWLSSRWVNQANTTQKAWLHSILAIVFTIILLIIYLRCLQSNSFPRFLLSQQSLSEVQNYLGEHD